MNNVMHCPETALEALLFGDEGSAAARTAAEHVETCPMCRARLAELAGDETEWTEIRGVLQDTAEVDENSEIPSPSHPPGSLLLEGSRGEGIARESISSLRLGFLAPPTHPEMLGRLGRYEIEQVIGAGGMGIVLKGHDSELNRPVAIKVLAPHLAFSGPARLRFAREARAAAAIVHEHVVAIHNVESEGEVPFLVMQYVPGRSLQDRVDQDGPLSAEEILRIGLQAAAGLAAAHAQGVVHRDVKPANLLLENGVDRALLTDFGLARAADDASLTHSGIVAGTPHYMSPEQAEGEPADARSDLFSLGAVLYFMAAGHPPFRAAGAMAVLHRICRDRHRPLRQVNPRLPDELIRIVDRLLAKKPSRRFASAADVQQALAGALSRLQEPGGGSRLRPRRWASVVLLSFVACGITGLGFLGKPAELDSKGTQAAAVGTEPDAAAGPVRNGESDSALHFGHETAAIHSSLHSLGTGFDITSFDDPWREEVKSITAQLTRLERAWTHVSLTPNQETTR